MTNETKVLISIAAITIAILGGGVWFFSNFQQPSTSTEQKADQAQLIKADSISFGNPNSSVKIVEFGDFQCPVCADAAPKLDALKKEYGQNINVVFRHYPLPQHPHAVRAAEVAEAANEQGKFWEMYDKLFQGQKDWAEVDNSKADEVFRKYAQELSLDMNKFNDGLSSGKFQNKIQNDYRDGNTLNINATPTFFFNGERNVGVFNLDSYKAKIKALLGNNPNQTSSPSAK